MLVRRHRELPALLCEQSSADKIVPTEEDFIKSNIAGFGNDIGKITNRITSMYEIQSSYTEDSNEYEVLDYRICCGQQHQQDVIDKIKGVIAKPMPRSWYDQHGLNDVPEDKKDLYAKIIADKKPYFMRYIYPPVSKEYEKYSRKADQNAMVKFEKTKDELLSADYDSLDDTEQKFVDGYKKNVVLGTNPCVVNKICWLFEERFDSARSRKLDTEFDYNILKSGAEYTDRERDAIKKLYDEYMSKLRDYMVFLDYEREDDYDSLMKVQMLKDDFIAKCSAVCPNEKVMCDVILDVTYCKDSSKSFAWGVCGKVIIDNLMEKYGRKLTYPELDENGEIYYCGNRFSLKTINVEEEC